MCVLGTKYSKRLLNVSGDGDAVGNYYETYGK